MKRINYKHYSLLAFLILSTLLTGINVYNSGVYADVHQLDGSTVGWFAPNEVAVFGSILILLIADVVYIFVKAYKK
jgi:hypothetical protein